eukprot:Sdes_comp9780_c0_seq1m1305
MDPNLIVELLSRTFSAEDSVRKDAEENLDKIGFQEGFGVALLQIVNQNSLNTALLQSAAIYLKNFINRHWRSQEISEQEIQEKLQSGVDIHRCFFISSTDKTFIRANILESLIRANPVAQMQIAVATGTIIRSDFYERWPDLVSKIAQYLQSTDRAVVHGALLAFRELSKKYEYKMNEERAPFIDVLNGIMPIVLNVLVSSLNCPPDEESFFIQKLCLKIYFTVVQHDLPATMMLPSSFQPWMQILIEIMDKSEPDCVAAMHADEEERAQSTFWKAKKWAMHILHRIYSRYGCVGMVAEEFLEFATYYVQSYSNAVIQVVLKKFSEKVAGVFFSPRFLQLLLSYSITAVNQSSAWKIIKPHAHVIVTHVIFPLLCYSDSDDILWNEDPYEYVRVKFDVFGEFSSPTLAAINLLQELVEKRKKATLGPILGFAASLLEEYSSAPVENRNPRLKDGVLNMIGNIASYINKKPEYQGQLENMLVIHVFPEFSSQYGFLRARACFVVNSFNQVKYRNENNIVTALSHIVRCINDTEIPVRVQAAIALRVLIKYKVGSETLRPVLQQVLVELIKLANDTENDDLTSVLEDLILKYDEEILPFGVDIMQQLVNSFIAMIDSEDENENDSNKSLTAMGLLYTIQTLLGVFVKTPALLVQLERPLLPLIIYVLETAAIDFMEEIFDILSSLTYFSPVVSPAMWQVFPVIFQSIMGDASCFIPELVPSIDNFISRGTDVFLSSPYGINY